MGAYYLGSNLQLANAYINLRQKLLRLIHEYGVFTEFDICRNLLEILYPNEPDSEKRYELYREELEDAEHS